MDYPSLQPENHALEHQPPHGHSYYIGSRPPMRASWRILAGLACLAIILGAVTYTAPRVGQYAIQLKNRLVASVDKDTTTQATLTSNVTISEEQLVIGVVKQANVSVVSIGTQSQSFNRFSQGSDSSSGSGSQDQGVGTGFVVAANGYIITNKHVVSDPGTYYVLDSTGKTYPVQSVYQSPQYDLALVKINATGLKPLQLADSSTLQVGQFAIAIGNALGDLQNSVTTGIVSGLDRQITAGDNNPYSQFQETLADVIQTDAAINPGNSGGPLLNSAGQVIGIDTAVSSNAQNIGFALPANLIKTFIAGKIGSQS